MRNDDGRAAVSRFVNPLKVRLIALALLSFTSVAMATDIMPLGDVRKGMRGYGLTVFDGSSVERFDVEVMGVLENISPGQSLILIRVESESTTKAGVIAGMSGSPVFLDEKLIGALAYSWQFSSAPIAGVTPIEQMLVLGESSSGGSDPVPAFNATSFLSALTQRDLSPALDRLTAAMTPARAMSGALPIAVPLSLGSFAPETIDRFSPWIEASGFVAVPSGSTRSAGSASAKLPEKSATPFAPGDAIAGVLVDGDFSVAATGTVTYVDKDRVFAFGHPFLDLGQISFPMAKADVIGVLPNLSRSFKFSNRGDVVGTFQQDRRAGILGLVGVDPQMIPVELTMNGGGGSKTYNVRIARHPQLSPLILAMAVDTVLASTEKAAGERTVVLDSEIDVEGFGTIQLRDGWAGAQARQSIPAYLAIVSSYLLSNEFHDAPITKIRVTMHHDDRLRIARVSEATLDVPVGGRIRPGDTIHIRTVLKPFRGESFVETLDVKIPDRQKPGQAYFYVGSGSAFNQIDFSLLPPDPRTLDQVVSIVRRLRPSNELTAGVYTALEGESLAGVYLPDLPPSIQAVIDGDTSNSTRRAIRYHGGEKTTRKLDYIVDGAIRIDFQIDPRM